MYKKIIIVSFLMLTAFASLQAQTTKSKKAVDTLLDYDALFDELDLFFDSLYTPKSFALINIGASTGYYNYHTSSPDVLTAKKQLTLSPSIGYYHKSGPGINLAGQATNEGTSYNLYQVAATASFDYLQYRQVIGGISFTHFFTKDSLPFYTSPLQNEAYAYVAVRKWWLQPGISASYGWGSRNNYEERKEYITALRKKKTITTPGYTEINTTERVSDFTLTASVKHDFYFLHTLLDRDCIRVTPQFAFTSGTQKFGFNQSSTTYTTLQGNNKSILYNSENVMLNNNVSFSPLNLTATLKTEYSIGKFFLQPQFLVDYYFPANNNKISTAFAINAGVLL